TLSEITSNLRFATRDMRVTIEKYGENFQDFSTESKQIVFRSVKFAQLIKAMIDTAILDQDGNLVLSTEKRVRDISAVSSGQKSSLDTP
ncbi:hypothetical protein KB219_33825, partial [Pseudomonas aeruginosa]|nr:hypothetical protein [Pseudomonas aeruginosa]